MIDRTEEEIEGCVRLQRAEHLLVMAKVVFVAAAAAVLTVIGSFIFHRI